MRTATTNGAPSALDLSLERLTSKECERLDSLLSGKWISKEAVAEAAKVRAEETKKAEAEEFERQYQELRANMIRDGFVKEGA